MKLSSLASGATCLMLSLGLLACGAEPASTKAGGAWQRPAPKTSGTMTPPEAPVAQPPAGGMASDIKPLLEGLSHTRSTLAGFTATISTSEKGSRGAVDETLKIAYKKPGTLFIEVAKSTASGNKGTRLLWPGGSELKVKPPYLPFAVSLKMSDDNLLSKNGWEIRETDVNSILNVLLSAKSTLTPMGTQVWNGKSLTMVQVKSTESPKGATHEIIGIDPTINLPMLRSIYKGSTLMYRMQILNIQLKTPSESQLKV
jgi:hypothetical protein